MFKKLFGAVLLVAIVLAGCGPSLPTKLDATPRIAVESAFGDELTLLLSKVAGKKPIVINGRTFTTGTLAGHQVVLTLSGVSMTNAAMTTQLLFDNFNISRLVFSGIAGGVNPNLNIGDVVVPAQWSEYQEMHFAREGKDGAYILPPWVKPDLPNFTFMFPEPVEVVKKGSEPDKGEPIRWFPADPSMLGVAKGVASAVKLEKCGIGQNSAEGCLTLQPMIKVGGNGVAGPTFVDNAKFREYAWTTFKADSLDMESSAVAHVAYSNGIPFIIFRSLSDLAGGGPGENEIGAFFAIAADNSATVVLSFLEALPK